MSRSRELKKTAEKKPQTRNKEKKTPRPVSGEFLLGLDFVCLFVCLFVFFVCLFVCFLVCLCVCVCLLFACSLVCLLVHTSFY